MHSFDPFAGLISQILAYQPPAPKMSMARVHPYERILAVQRMDRGESPTEIARELGVTKSAVMKWRQQAREARS